MAIAAEAPFILIVIPGSVRDEAARGPGMAK
jgi:hypothetical protein